MCTPAWAPKLLPKNSCLQINRSSFHPVSSGPKIFVKINGLFKTKFSTKRYLCESILYESFFLKL